ncbi:MAG: glycosyltransferase family 39 protein [candidate division WWE3 bacterium]|nr:glycosyltransferase family 39 protein [candidate division WWE3 bacterium]
MKAWLTNLWKNYKVLIVFLVVLTIFRIAIININVTEWGDSFRILRAAKYLLNLTYPLDEKRLPFFSLLLSPGILVLEPVLWGRIFAIGMTIVNLFLTAILFRTLFPKVKNSVITLAVVLLAINPIFFYWSLRIMAETTFVSLVLLAFIVYFKGIRSNRSWWPYFLGLVLALGALTRYEGFLLSGSFGLVFLLKRQWSNIFKTFSVWFVLVAPWFVLTKLILHGGTSNAYVSELGTFNFDLNRLGYFITYTLFFLGYPILLSLIVPSIISWRKRLVSVIHAAATSPLWIFVAIEVALFFVWTPSLPRIMLSVIPVAYIFATKALSDIDFRTNRKILILSSSLLLIMFVVLQLKFRMYFLVLSRLGEVLIIGLSILGIIAMWRNSKKLFLTGLILSCLIGSFVVVANQRLVYSTIYDVSLKAAGLPGNIAFSDETGVSAWYLGNKGVYYNPSTPMDVTKQTEWLHQNNIAYVINTNEFNRGDALNLSKLACSQRVNVTIADTLDIITQRLGLLKNKQYPVLYSDICKV